MLSFVKALAVAALLALSGQRLPVTEAVNMTTLCANVSRAAPITEGTRIISQPTADGCVARAATVGRNLGIDPCSGLWCYYFGNPSLDPPCARAKAVYLPEGNWLGPYVSADNAAGPEGCYNTSTGVPWSVDLTEKGNGTVPIPPHLASRIASGEVKIADASKVGDMNCAGYQCNNMYDPACSAEFDLTAYDVKGNRKDPANPKNKVCAEPPQWAISTDTVNGIQTTWAYLFRPQGFKVRPDAYPMGLP